MWKWMTTLVVMFVLSSSSFAGTWTLIDDFSGDLSKWMDKTTSPGTAKIAEGKGPDGSPALELDMRAKATGKFARIALIDTPQFGSNDALKIAFDMRIDPGAVASYASGLIFTGSPTTIRVEQYGKSNWDSVVCGQFCINKQLQGKPEKGDRRKQIGKWYHYEIEMTLEGSSEKVYDWISSKPGNYIAAKPIWKGAISDVVGDCDYVLELHNNSRIHPDRHAQNRGLSRFDNIYYKMISE